MGNTYTEMHREVMENINRLTPDVGASKFDVVDETGIFRLLHYRNLTETRYSTPLLIVYAWINRPYVLDLQPEISIIQKYLRTGFNIYMIDWGYPTVADQFLDLDDYLSYVDRSVVLIKARENVPTVSMHGYCLGGTLSAAYVALRQSNVKNLILQAAPIDFDTDNPIALWAKSIDPGKVVQASRLATGELLNTGFLLADPINLVIGKYEGFLDMQESDSGMTSFLRMDRWIFDSPAIPGETYRQYITEFYQKNALLKGNFRALGGTADLHKITIPVLVLSAKYDHIVPPPSQMAILDALSSQDKTAYEMAKGHIGISTSRDSHREFWPKVLMWLESRSDKSIRKFNNFPDKPGKRISSSGVPNEEIHGLTPKEKSQQAKYKAS